MIKISVIMPSFNVVSYIEECIQSVIDQTLSDIEIICVDAGSNDGTLELLKKYEGLDNRIRLVHSDKGSYGYQVNLGIRLAQGEYIGIVETDDFIEKTMYEDLYDYAVSVNADVVKAPYIEYYNKRNREVCYFVDKFNEILEEGRCYSMKENACLLAYHPSIWSGIYRREYLIKNDISFVEAKGAGYVDAAFRFDTSINTDRNAWLNKAAYCYRVSNPLSSTNDFKFSIMLDRWNEVHKKLVSRQKEYDLYYGPFSITDEYDATLGHLGKRILNQEEMEKLIENFSYIKEDTVRRSIMMPDRLKNNVLAFKEDPYAYYRKKHRFFYLKQIVFYFGNLILPKGTKRRNYVKRLMSVCRGDVK